MTISASGAFTHLDEQGFSTRDALTGRPGKSLNGRWRFAADTAMQWERPSQVQWASQPINGPFAPEWKASGQWIIEEPINRSFVEFPVDVPTPEQAGMRTVVTFGAVDHDAYIFVDDNDEPIAHHVGGHTPFSVDLTSLGVGPGAHTITVRADDRLDDRSTPQGKQDVKVIPSDIYYTATTGAWQPVTVHQVPAQALGRIKLQPDVANRRIGVSIEFDGEPPADAMVTMELGQSLGYSRTSPLGTKSVPVADLQRGQVWLDLASIVPDHQWPALLWSPDRPVVIDAVVTLRSQSGEVLDQGSAYTGLRDFGVVKAPGDVGRFAVNGVETPMRGVLRQGFHPHQGLTRTVPQMVKENVALRSAGVNTASVHGYVPSAEECEAALRAGIMLCVSPPAPRETTRLAMQRTLEAARQIGDYIGHQAAIAMAIGTIETWGVEEKTVPGYRSLSAEEQETMTSEQIAAVDARNAAVVAAEFPEGFDVAVEQFYAELTQILEQKFPTAALNISDGWKWRLPADPARVVIFGQHDYHGPEEVKERYSGGDVLGRLSQLDPGRPLLPAGFDIKTTDRPVCLMITEMHGRALKGATIDGAVAAARHPLYVPEAEAMAPGVWGYGDNDGLSPEEYAEYTHTYMDVATGAARDRAAGIIRGPEAPSSGGIITQEKSVAYFYPTPDGPKVGGEDNGIFDASGDDKLPRYVLRDAIDPDRLSRIRTTRLESLNTQQVINDGEGLR